MKAVSGRRHQVTGTILRLHDTKHHQGFSNEENLCTVSRADKNLLVNHTVRILPIQLHHISPDYEISTKQTTLEEHTESHL